MSGLRQIILLNCKYSVSSETDLRDCSKQMRTEKVIWYEEKAHDFNFFFIFYIFRVSRTNRRADLCHEWLYRFFCSAVVDILLSTESCEMKTVKVGSYPQRISCWLDIDWQEVKQELGKCVRYFRKSKDKCREYKCLLVVAFSCIWGLGGGGEIFVESTHTCTFA